MCEPFAFLFPDYLFYYIIYTCTKQLFRIVMHYIRGSAKILSRSDRLANAASSILLFVNDS